MTRSRKKAENDWNASPAGGNDGFDWEAFQRYDDAAAWEKPKRGGGTRSVRRSGRPVTTGRQAAPKRIAAKGRNRPENCAAVPGCSDFALPQGGVVACFDEIFSAFRIKWLYLRDLYAPVHAGTKNVY